MTSRDPDLDGWMRLGVRLAARGHGHVEPNPMVGCVVLDRTGALAGWGWHRRVGMAHAEVEALRRAGPAARGGTMIVTLEPCAHHGRTPPCTEAIAAAGVSRVIYGATDVNPEAGGGAAWLRGRGISVEQRLTREAADLNAPFAHRITTGLPWVAVKWAQTIDGAIATRAFKSRWISSARSRAMVHRERGRVDCIMVGIGTALADDPLLTARDVTLRRRALRVVVDPKMQLPPGSRLVTTAKEVPTVLAVRPDAATSQGARAEELSRAGVQLLPYDGTMAGVLRELLVRHSVARLLVEGGGGLVGQLMREGLVNEWWVFLAPTLMGDPAARGPVRGFQPESMEEIPRRRLVGSWRRGDDILLVYR